MKQLILAILLSFSFSGSGQDYAYLEKVPLKKKTDYSDSKEDVIKATDYLMTTPIDEKNINRKYCTRFLIRYAEGSPTVTLTLDASIMKVCEHNDDILSLYIGLWLKSALTNEGKSDSFHEESVYTELSEYASDGNGIVLIKSLIEAGKNSEINEWIANLKK